MLIRCTRAYIFEGVLQLCRMPIRCIAEDSRHIGRQAINRRHGHDGVCEINTLFVSGACRPPPSPFIPMFTNVRKACAIRLRNKHTFTLVGLGHLCHNFEIWGAGWPREETTQNQKCVYFAYTGILAKTNYICWNCLHFELFS